MKKTLVWVSIFFASAAMLSGCGSNSKADPGAIPGSSNITLSLDPMPVGLVDTHRGTYIATYAVHAVDANGRPKSRLPIDVALVNTTQMNGFTGAIHKTEPVTFSDGDVNFAARGVKAGDTLIIKPVTFEEKERSYVGNWKITKVANNLTLGADPVYNLVEAGGLPYAVGNEVNEKGYLAHVQFPDNNVSGKVHDAEKGLTFFEIVFDKEMLAGKSSTDCVAWVGVHLSGNRTGTARCVHAVAAKPPVDNSENNGTGGSDGNTTGGSDGNTTGGCTGGTSCSGKTSTCTSGKCPNAK